MTETQEYVVLVDEQDRPIGKEEKMRAHELGLLHRAFSVFIFRKKGDIIEFLLQQRHGDKYHCGDLWTNTCCSHPRWNETVIDGGQRRLKEEMSLDISLTHAGSFIYRAPFQNGLIEHEFDHVLLGEYEEGMSIEMNPNEVQNYDWVSADKLLEDLDQEPHPTKSKPGRRRVYTPWLKPGLKIALEHLCYSF